MKINEGFELRTVCDENVIVAYGRKNIDFSKVISSYYGNIYGNWICFLCFISIFGIEVHITNCNVCSSYYQKRLLDDNS